MQFDVVCAVQLIAVCVYVDQLDAQIPTGLYQLRCTTSKNFAPDDGLKSPKHVEHLIINKDSL